MAEFLKLKSRANVIHNYRTVDISSFVPEFEVDELQLKRDMDRIINSHSKKVEAEVVSLGDQIELSCKSANAKFNKDKVFVMVGKKLFSKELEEKIVGFKKGESKAITVGNEEVTVCINSILHTQVVSLDNETIKSWGMDGIECEADIRKYCVDKQITRFLDDDESADMAVACISQAVSEKSKIEFDNDELEAVKAYAEKKFAEVASSFDENDTEFSLDEYKSFIDKIYISELNAAVIGQMLLEKQNKLLTADDYNNDIQKRAVALEASVEEAKKSFSVFDYIRESYAGYYIDILDAYVAEYIKRAINP